MPQYEVRLDGNVRYTETVWADDADEAQDKVFDGMKIPYIEGWEIDDEFEINEETIQVSDDDAEDDS